MHVMRVLDKSMVRRLWNLRPHRSVLSLDSPHQISGVFKQQPPITLTMYNWLYGDTYAVGLNDSVDVTTVTTIQ